MLAPHFWHTARFSLIRYSSYAMSNRNGESQWRDEGLLPSCSINSGLLNGELHSNSERI